MFSKIVNILETYLSEKPKQPITIHTDLQNDLGFDLGLDELDIFEIITNLEETFYINIPDDPIPNIKTAGDIFTIVKACMLEKYKKGLLKEKLHVYGDIFYNKLVARFPEHQNNIEILDLIDCCSISLEAEDKTYGKPLIVSLITKFNEMTVGHEFEDHEHFSKDIDGEDFIEKAFKYVDTIYLK